MNFLVKSFNRNTNIELCLKHSFETFINQNDRTAKSLVAYLDEKFKREFRGMEEVTVNETLDKVISIFRYLQDKDVFEGLYKLALSKRLLTYQNSVNMDAEQLMVKKLKEECGF